MNTSMLIMQSDLAVSSHLQEVLRSAYWHPFPQPLHLYPLRRPEADLVHLVLVSVRTGSHLELPGGTQLHPTYLAQVVAVAAQILATSAVSAFAEVTK